MLTLPEKGQWLVYILQCKDNSYYTGITNDMATRLRAHETGVGAKYTRGRQPLKLVYFECHTGKSQSLKREYEIKSLSRMQKQQLISSGGISSSLDGCN